jgi:hypothetical protein
MISEEPIHDASPRDALARHLACELATRLGAERLAPGERQVADAVAAYWLSHHAGDGLSAEFIDLLVGRALCAAGLKDAAARWMACGKEGGRAVDPLLSAFSSSSCSSSIFATLSSHLVRPSQWHCASGGITWTLDCGRLALGDAAGFEMLCLTVLRSLVRGVAPLWDEAGGQGALGLRGAQDLARRALGDGAPRKQVEAFRENIEDLCAASLETAARERGWANVPALVRVD